MSREMVEFGDVLCKHETTDALLCEIDGEKVWIPKSQIGDDSEVCKPDDRGNLVITEWIALEKELI